MAIRGLEIFERHFADHEGSFLLIGGAACADWFATQGLSFRATEDLDIVLILDALSRPFVTRLHEFIRSGGYRLRHRSDGGLPILYRFSEPDDKAYPIMLEIFGRKESALMLEEGQQIVPVRIDGADSLSAILLDDDYYEFLLSHHHSTRGIWMANAAALIPLKSRAWLDLSARRTKGEGVDIRNIKKHRNDVFALAATLPTEPTESLPASIASDVNAFLANFPVESSEWEAILKALRDTLGGQFKPETLSNTIRTYYTLVK